MSRDSSASMSNFTQSTNRMLFTLTAPVFRLRLKRSCIGFPGVFSFCSVCCQIRATELRQLVSPDQPIPAGILQRAAEPDWPEKICLRFFKGGKPVERRQFYGQVCECLADIRYPILSKRHKKHHKIAKCSICCISQCKLATL